MKDENFIYPHQMEKMSVEQALDYFELAAMDHHAYIYNDSYDLAKILVLKCNVDPDYVLSNLSFIISNYLKKETIDEIKKHIIDENSIDTKLFEQELEKKKQDDKRNKTIDAAKERYNKLKSLKKILHTIKYGKPSDKVFNEKNEEEINQMYNSSKKTK